MVFNQEVNIKNTSKNLSKFSYMGPISPEYLRCGRLIRVTKYHGTKLMAPCLSVRVPQEADQIKDVRDLRGGMLVKDKEEGAGDGREHAHTMMQL